MDNLFAGYKLPETKKATKYQWQDRVLEIAKILKCNRSEQSSLFRKYKQDKYAVESAFNYMCERNVGDARYLFKMLTKNK